MKSGIILFLSFSLTLYSCFEEEDQIENISNQSILDSRTPYGGFPTYILSYKGLDGEVKFKTCSDPSLQNSGWSTEYGTGTMTISGTTSTIYGFPPQHLVLYAGYNVMGVADIFYSQSPNGMNWSMPLPTSTFPIYIPCVENIDGLAYEVHIKDQQNLPNGYFNVLMSHKTPSSQSWSTPYNVINGTNNSIIHSELSPSIEYHIIGYPLPLIVDYLVTCERYDGIRSRVSVYWRYLDQDYIPTQSPGIELYFRGHNLYNSVCPIAVIENQVNKLFLFTCQDLISNGNGDMIVFKRGTTTNIPTNGHIVSWDQLTPIPNTSTETKVDGIFEASSKRIILAYNNNLSSKIDIAISSDFGSTWQIISNIADSQDRASPSITCLQ